ncbi:MAG: hypothetical protein ACKPKO_01425, partial [Candidatus Fonsibacter sp.]
TSATAKCAAVRREAAPDIKTKGIGPVGRKAAVTIEMGLSSLPTASGAEVIEQSCIAQSIAVNSQHSSTWWLLMLFRSRQPVPCTISLHAFVVLQTAEMEQVCRPSCDHGRDSVW